MGLPNYFFSDLDNDIKAILFGQIRNLWTHTSTALEGNSLTLGETAFVLEEGLTVAGKPLRDHQEVFGHAQAIDIVYGLIAVEQIQKADLFALHRALLTEVILDIYKPVGDWKKEPNYTNYIGTDGCQHMREFPSPAHITELMSQWLDRLNKTLSRSLSEEGCVQVYADLHLDLVTTHPFFDGNGRIARLISNLPVLRAGYPPLVVPTDARHEYRRAISDYQSTIPSLDSLKDLDTLPDNEERRQFIDLCKGYLEPTMALVRESRAMQQKRSIERSIVEQPEVDIDIDDDLGR
ncbi:MAG: Fic family protein [Burkholderiales bacterium]